MDLPKKMPRIPLNGWGPCGIISQIRKGRYQDRNLSSPTQRRGDRNVGLPCECFFLLFKKLRTSYLHHLVTQQPCSIVFHLGPSWTYPGPLQVHTFPMHPGMGLMLYLLLIFRHMVSDIAHVCSEGRLISHVCSEGRC